MPSEQKNSPLRLGFIGAGRMATALAKGCVKAAVVDAKLIVASDPHAAALQTFAANVPGTVAAHDNRDVLTRADVVVLAVKPQTINAVLGELRDAVRLRHLVVSIAAGVTLERLAGQLPPATRLVRVMPNTPCLIGLGASVFSRGKNASDADVAFVQMLLQSVGLALEMQETHLDAVTGLSGSGPAFVYTMVEALAQGGVEAGLPSELALQLAVQTVRGAAEMCAVTGLTPAELRDQVTSPGGTTLAGLAALERAGGPGAMRQAVAAATLRSSELGAS